MEGDRRYGGEWLLVYQQAQLNDLPEGGRVNRPRFYFTGSPSLPEDGRGAAAKEVELEVELDEVPRI